MEKTQAAQSDQSQVLHSARGISVAAVAQTHSYIFKEVHMHLATA